MNSYLFFLLKLVLKKLQTLRQTKQHRSQNIEAQYGAVRVWLSHNVSNNIWISFWIHILRYKLRYINKKKLVIIRIMDYFNMQCHFGLFQVQTGLLLSQWHQDIIETIGTSDVWTEINSKLVSLSNYSQFQRYCHFIRDFFKEIPGRNTPHLLWLGNSGFSKLYFFLSLHQFSKIILRRLSSTRVILMYHKISWKLLFWNKLENSEHFGKDRNFS